MKNCYRIEYVPHQSITRRWYRQSWKCIENGSTYATMSIFRQQRYGTPYLYQKVTLTKTRDAETLLLLRELNTTRFFVFDFSYYFHYSFCIRDIPKGKNNGFLDLRFYLGRFLILNTNHQHCPNVECRKQHEATKRSTETPAG